MKKKVLSNKKREVLLFTERLLSVVLAVSMTFIFINSFFNISTSYGTTYHYAVSPLDQEQSFEEKEIFQALLTGNMEQITRYVVIRHQLETNGNYDENKKVEITQYANRSTGMTEGMPTAEYYLDDLVTWGNYGFTYKTVVGTWEELNALFAKRQPMVQDEFLSTEGDEAVNPVKEYAGSIEDNAVQLGLEAAEDDKYVMEILVARYKTVDGKDLMQCADNVEEYEILKKNLEESAKSLFANYTEYVGMKEQYSAENTNIGYCFQVPSEKGLQYYTNSEELQLKGKNADDITAIVKEQGGKFLYFNPDKVQINTNTEISAKQMRSMLKEHEYTFGDNTRVWVWVDTQYPANDSLQMVKNELDAFRPYFITLLACAASAAVLGLLIVIYLTYKEGRMLDENGEIKYAIRKQDRVPLEIWLSL